MNMCIFTLVISQINILYYISFKFEHTGLGKLAIHDLLTLLKVCLAVNPQNVSAFFSYNNASILNMF